MVWRLWLESEEEVVVGRKRELKGEIKSARKRGENRLLALESRDYYDVMLWSTTFVVDE